MKWTKENIAEFERRKKVLIRKKKFQHGIQFTDMTNAEMHYLYSYDKGSKEKVQFT